MTTTLNWYKENAEEFITRTLTVDMTELLDNFIKYIPHGGKILDLGCGAGAASLYFQSCGFDVMPVDGCPEMCEAAARLIGKEARNIMFHELDYDNEFDVSVRDMNSSAFSLYQLSVFVIFYSLFLYAVNVLFNLLSCPQNNGFVLILFCDFGIINPSFFISATEKCEFYKPKIQVVFISRFFSFFGSF